MIEKTKDPLFNDGAEKGIQAFRKVFGDKVTQEVLYPALEHIFGKKPK